MKRVLLSVLMLFLMSMIAFGQQEVTKFLGIPVDGSKKEMIRKLKEKGFEQDPLTDNMLTGEFNGTNVNVYVVTNNNKVWRIMVCDAITQTAGNIKIRFNKLCQQFDNNERYLSGAPDTGFTISDEEDIAYKILVTDKRYEATYFQLPTNMDSMKEINRALKEKYTEEQLQNLTLEQKTDAVTTALLHLYEISYNRMVWFMISSANGQYYITMYYDNVCNQANGEDL